MMHVIDVVLSSLASLFRFHRYPPVEKLYSVFLFAAGLSLRDLTFDALSNVNHNGILNPYAEGNVTHDIDHNTYRTTSTTTTTATTTRTTTRVILWSGLVTTCFSRVEQCDALLIGLINRAETLKCALK